VRVREAADPADLLPTLWARAMIRTLEEDDGVRPSISASTPTARRAQLIELSKRYNLLCGLTSFVAVEHRSVEDRNEGRPALRRVPIQLVAGAAAGGEDLSMDIPLGAVAAAPAARARSFRQSIRACIAPRRMAAGGGGPTLDKTLDKTIDRFKDSMDMSMDKSLDRSIDKSIDLSGMDEATANDPTHAPMIKLVQAMLAEAVRSRASEVHIEPRKDRIQVRYRIDGQCVERDRIPVRMKGPLVSRLKIMGGMNLLEKRLPQDGHIRLTVDKVDVDFRVSTLPSFFGESIVVRIVRPGDVVADPAPQAGGDDDALLHLLAHQAADGSFDDSAAVDQAVRGTRVDRAHLLAEIDRVLHEAHVPSSVRPKLAHTLLILLALRMAFADRKPLWQRAFKKGLRHVADVGQLHAGQAEAWLAEIEASFRKPA